MYVTTLQSIIYDRKNALCYMQFCIAVFQVSSDCRPTKVLCTLRASTSVYQLTVATHLAGLIVGCGSTARIAIALV